MLHHTPGTAHPVAPHAVARPGQLPSVPTRRALAAFHQPPRSTAAAARQHFSSQERRSSRYCAANGTPPPSSSPAGGGSNGGQPPHGSGSSRQPGGGGDGSGDEGGGSAGSTPKQTWPRWYQVWIWATALTYLVWRFKWRRDRRLAAEQFASEQQQEEELRQEWAAFAQSYGVKTPPPNSSS